MRICIDSCVYILGLNDPLTDARQLLNEIHPPLQVLAPRLVALEVTRNLRLAADIETFYGLFQNPHVALLVEEAVPASLVQRYVDLGLNAKGDAIIGAFAEWMQVSYLISDNRHCLRQLQTDAYRVATPGEFLDLLAKLSRP